MWIVINPSKAHRFTTEGINLDKKNPTAYVNPNFKPEVMMRINTALAEGKILRIDGKESFKIQDQAELSLVGRTENDDKKIRAEVERDPDTNRITSTTITMPDTKGNVTKTKMGPAIIMTGITETALEDE